ncbi:tyrosine-type recombinase/integrase [Massilioclostridium coli]|uniref:tyrosine-type recombinase/integrase n=1 Tax=Massilioclostridium coli TaxID=1870991 RepID=UPI00085BE534|nr:site-specific integrase [Massilioclostridium coli]
MVKILKQILHYGEIKGYIPPIQYEITKPSVPRKEIEVLTEEEQVKLVKYIKANIRNEIKGVGILLSLYAGTRLGEICALRWKDLRLDIGIINITKTMQRVKNTDKEADTKTKIVIDTPKTQNSIRQIPIPDFLLTELKIWSERYPENAYILTGDTEKYIEPRSYQNSFKRYLKQTGIRNINFHALRHPYVKSTTKKYGDFFSTSKSQLRTAIPNWLYQYTLSCYARSFFIFSTISTLLSG